MGVGVATQAQTLRIMALVAKVGKRAILLELQNILPVPVVERLDGVAEVLGRLTLLQTRVVSGQIGLVVQDLLLAVMAQNRMHQPQVVELREPGEGAGVIYGAIHDSVLAAPPGALS